MERRACPINKAALITGGSHGLGLAVAEELLNRGYDLLLSAMDERGLATAKSQLNGKTRVEYYAGDITLARTADSLEKTCRDRFGRLNLLVNNAGIFKSGSLEEFTEESWDKILSVNLRAHFLVTKAMLPLLRESRGTVIFINSIGGKIGLKDLSAYNASKYGLRGLADSLRLELKDYGIRVTSIFPHGMNSAGKEITDDDPRRWTMIETADVAHIVGEVADGPERIQIPEITVYPRSTEITKQEKPL
jgi:NAD(P)-dependent dehydrogenase (short-subunit alcohol dehydrogenase family)